VGGEAGLLLSSSLTPEKLLGVQTNPAKVLGLTRQEKTIKAWGFKKKRGNAQAEENRLRQTAAFYTGRTMPGEGRDLAHSRQEGIARKRRPKGMSSEEGEDWIPQDGARRELRGMFYKGGDKGRGNLLKQEYSRGREDSRCTQGIGRRSCAL